jgi:pyochelin synthetase
MTTKGNASHPGGVFRVLAVVHSARADRPTTVDAIVHFASGDVAVVLTRSGGGAAYHANVPVPAAEPAGTVLIDATVVVAGATLTATGSGKIVIGDTTEAPATAAAPAEAPATCTPEASDAPEASETPDESEAPEASDAPDASSSPDADESSDKCDSGDAPNVNLSVETITRLIAYLQSLLTATA